MNDITISRVDGKDLDAIIPGIVNVFRDDEIVPWHKYDSCLAWVKRRAERGFYITMAYVDGKIVGYSEWIETYDDGKKFLYLGLMQVDCDLRSRGIGKVMLSDGEMYAKSIGASHLRTIPEEDRSCNFYLKYGFAETDTIFYCVCAVKANTGLKKSGEPSGVTLGVTETKEFIFGLCQASGRHMFEVANHNSEIGEFYTVASFIPGGYLQFRYREDSKTALALYWSNEPVTAETVSGILAYGYAEGFEEIEFYFKSKYRNLFAGFEPVRESIIIERKLS